MTRPENIAQDNTTAEKIFEFLKSNATSITVAIAAIAIAYVAVTATKAYNKLEKDAKKKKHKTHQKAEGKITEIKEVKPENTKTVSEADKNKADTDKRKKQDENTEDNTKDNIEDNTKDNTEDNTEDKIAATSSMLTKISYVAAMPFIAIKNGVVFSCKKIAVAASFISQKTVQGSTFAYNKLSDGCSFIYECLKSSRERIASFFSNATKTEDSKASPTPATEMKSEVKKVEKNEQKTTPQVQQNENTASAGMAA